MRNSIRHWTLVALLGLGVACSDGEERAEEAAAETAEETAEPAEDPNAITELENASVSFVGLESGATLTGPETDGKVSVHVEMNVEGAEVRPAGELEAGTGHHHIIVDGEGVPFGTPVVNNETHLHFGGGQTEADIELPPGEHTLTLQFADGAHRSYGPALTSTVTVTIAAETSEAETEAAAE